MTLSEIEFNQINHRFYYHPPQNETEVHKHERVREELRYATQNILNFIPPGREASLFTTKMEEAMMWANAAIARNKE